MTLFEAVIKVGHAPEVPLHGQGNHRDDGSAKRPATGKSARAQCDSSVPCHHPPCAEDCPGHQPGNDDTDGHGGRLRHQQWVSLTPARPSSAATEQRKATRRQVGPLRRRPPSAAGSTGEGYGPGRR